MARVIPFLIVLVLLGAGALGVTLPSARMLAPAGEARAIGPPGQNDAGSGQDAGNSAGEALRIPNAQRIWSANLTPAGTDADWYRLGGGDAFCAVASATTQSPGQFSLASSPQLDQVVSRDAAAHRSTRLALAAPAGRAPFLGVEPPTMMLMAASESVGAPTPSRYTFAFASRSYEELDPEADGESPEAGETPASSVGLPAECAAGRLSVADNEDRYHLDVAQSGLLSLSFAIAIGEGAQLRVVSPSGATRATLASGDARDILTNEPGRWSVIVARTSSVLVPTASARFTLAAADNTGDVGYLLGVVTEPEPEPCRPTCR